jgi:hypothetical protein
MAITEGARIAITQRARQQLRDACARFGELVESASLQGEVSLAVHVRRLWTLAEQRAIMVTSTLDLKQVHRRCVPQGMREMCRPFNDGHELSAVVTALATGLRFPTVRSDRHAHTEEWSVGARLVSQSHDERRLSLGTHPGRRRAKGGAGGAGWAPPRRCSRRSRGGRGR